MKLLQKQQVCSLTKLIYIVAFDTVSNVTAATSTYVSVT